MKRTFSIIVPALNEEKNLQAAVREIIRCFRQIGAQFEILIFNDRSDDGTGAVAEALAREEPHLRVFHNPRRMNIGGIFKAAVREARCEYCLLLPGDNEVAVAEVLAGVYLLEQADLAVTYTANQQIRPLLRRLLSRTYTRFVNMLFGTDFAYTNGSNICRTDLLRRITIHTDGFSYQTEALVKLVRQGVDFVEYGINIAERAYGKSTALAFGNWMKVIKAICRLYWDVRVVNRNQYSRMGRKLASIPRTASHDFSSLFDTHRELMLGESQSGLREGAPPD